MVLLRNYYLLTNSIIKSRQQGSDANQNLEGETSQDGDK